MIPFNVDFTGREDVHLEDTLRVEAPGILAWCIEGARRVFDGEPEVPVAVRAAVEAYRAESDLLGQFLEDETVEDQNATVLKSALYAAYQKFTGGRAGSPKAFSQKVSARGFGEHRDRRGRYWQGIRLLDNDLQ